MIPLIPVCTIDCLWGGMLLMLAVGAGWLPLHWLRPIQRAPLWAGTSDEALARARANLQETGLTNVQYCNPFQEPLPQTRFDLITTFDVIHDTPYPQDLIGQIYAALKDDGRWLCRTSRI